MATLLKCDGTSTEVFPKGEHFTLEEMYFLLRCDYVELLQIPENKWLVMDEEGMFNGKPMNVLASYTLGFTVVGNVLLANIDELDSPDTDTH